MAKSDKKAAAREFAGNWKGRGYEKGDAQVFWGELLCEVVGLDRISQRCKFEYRTSSGGFIDCLIPDAGVLVEQKGLGVDLDKPEERQGRMVTPFGQALAYAEDFPQDAQPRFIVVCNFATFRVHDRKLHHRTGLADNYLQFTLEELGENPHLLDFIVKPENSREEIEKQASIAAGERVGQLFGMLRDQYIDPDSAQSQHALNVLCVRMVFCLFCEDADLFEKDALLNYLRRVEPENIRLALKDLFRALDTPVSERDPYDKRFTGFPYVNGGLFAEDVEIPNFTEDMKHTLLFDISQRTDWSSISPTIFGGIFEGTLNPETRHAGGMHYTSPENIHKVIDPLFLDGLREEFDSIRFDEDLTPKKRRRSLQKFREKIAGLTFFDPACGSGNFLTETYLCLRELEDDVINECNDGQRDFDLAIAFDSGTDAGALANEHRVSLDQFYGIEINEFAVSVAKTALWIAQLQANRRSERVIATDIADFPLHDHAHIVQANALRADWNDVLPAEQCDYIMGNPPFVGYSNHNEAQKEDRALLFGKVKTVDYVACWYKKAASYMKDNPEMRAAFVSTNSICQGQQVEPIWKPLFDDGIYIDFAWPSFVWNSEAADQAHVHVVVVGFSRKRGKARLFSVEGVREAGNINGYLSPAESVFVNKRGKPLCNVEEMAQGFKPADNGNLLMWEEERDALLASDPGAADYIRPFSMGAEFISGKKRYCLWIPDAISTVMEGHPAIAERVSSCRAWRCEQTKAGDAYKLRDTPHLLRPCGKFKDGTYIGVPKVSSERRRYIPMGFVTDGMIPGDMLYFVADAGLYEFGMLESQFFNAWMRVTSGRLEMRYRISNTIVYNNFPWPGVAPETLGVPVAEAVPPSARKAVEGGAQAVLDARAAYPGKSLADLYDPDDEWLYPELSQAHRALDAAVEAAYGVNFQGDEEKMVAHLFELYAGLTAGD